METTQSTAERLNAQWIQDLSEKTLVLCYQNCSDLLWEKNCSCDQEKLLKFNVEGQEFAKILRFLQQFIQKVKGQNNFWFNGMLFETVPRGFSYELH